jgi:2-methylcitrate dehydratase PrpD
MTSVTDRYIDSLYELTQIDFPERVILQAKRCLLDYLGVTFAGAILLKDKGNVFLNNSEIGDISVIGFNRKSNLYNAALINGMSAHIADLDDGIRQGNFHPGAPIISALLPVVQQYKLSGKDLLKGMIVGYESAIRLACAIQPSHRNKGYHAIGTCGVIGAALGVGAALGFSKLQMKNALSAAATSSSGMLNVIRGASELKPYNAGQASVSGIMAALVAQSGFNGSSDVLTGQCGFINMMTDKSDNSILEKQSDKYFEIERIYMKLFAACRHCHPAIEATLMLKEKQNIKSEQISEIIVKTYQLGACEHSHTIINSIADAKMSIPYSVAVAFITGNAGINEYSEKMIHNKQIINLSDKVKVIVDDALNSLVPDKRPAIVNITTNNHEHFAFRVDLAKGEPENPLTLEEINEKFISLSLFGNKTTDYANKASSLVWNIETEVSKILNIL